MRHRKVPDIFARTGKTLYQKIMMVKITIICFYLLLHPDIVTPNRTHWIRRGLARMVPIGNAGVTRR